MLKSLGTVAIVQYAGHTLLAYFNKEAIAIVQWIGNALSQGA